METHTETIKCPECGRIQSAEVEHTIPFYSYVHTCVKCKYIIMESEWIVVTKRKLFNQWLKHLKK